MWKCKVCGEAIDDQFDACWRCAGDADPEVREEASAPAFEETFESSEECAHCGSKRVVPNAVLGDQGEYSDGKAHVRVSANPVALLFKGTVRSEVIAKLCCECGRLDFRAVGSLDALWEAYAKSVKQQ